MKAIWMLRSLRFGALLIFLCTFIRFVSNCEVTDDVLISFPMYPIFILFDALNEKTVASILFSFLVNLIFWLPINKVYHNIYGILVIERCKAFFMVIGYIFVFAGATLFQKSYLGEGWGLLISIGYFAWLQYGLKAFDNTEFLSYTGIKAPVEESPRSYIAVGIIHCVVYLILAAELHAPHDNVRIFTEEIEVPNSIIKDIALDGKSALLITESRSMGAYPLREKWKISRIDLEGNSIYPVDLMENYGFAEFSDADRYICIEKNDYKEETKSLIFYEWKSGLIEKMREIRKQKDYSVQNIKFSDGESYLSTIGYITDIWDFHSSKRIATYEKFVDLEWLENNAYVMFQSHNDQEKEFVISMTWNEILADGSIKENVKGKMTRDVENKLRKLKGFGNILKKIDEKSICVITSAKAKNNFWNYDSHIVFWDVESERKLFSRSSGNEILDIVFLAEKNQFLVIERMKNKRIKIEFWNLEKKKIEKVVFLQGVSPNTTKKELKVINEGTRFAEIGKTTKVWDID